MHRREDLTDCDSRLQVDPDGAADVVVSLLYEGEDSGGDGGPLHGKGRHHQVEPHAAVAAEVAKEIPREAD